MPSKHSRSLEISLPIRSHKFSLQKREKHQSRAKDSNEAHLYKATKDPAMGDRVGADEGEEERHKREKEGG